LFWLLLLFLFVFSLLFLGVHAKNGPRLPSAARANVRTAIISARHFLEGCDILLVAATEKAARDKSPERAARGSCFDIRGPGL